MKEAAPQQRQDAGFTFKVRAKGGPSAPAADAAGGPVRAKPGAQPAASKARTAAPYAAARVQPLPPAPATGGSRRPSLSQRGTRRTSATTLPGCPVPPHSSIHPAQYYAHVQPDAPDPVRLRWVLAWTMLLLRKGAPADAATTTAAGGALPHVGKFRLYESEAIFKGASAAGHAGWWCARR